MHLQLKAIYFISILFFLLNCSAKDVRLADPYIPINYSKQGLAAFGIYSFREWGFNKKKVGEPIKLFKVQLAEITSIDEKNNKVESTRLNLENIFLNENDSPEKFNSLSFVKNFNIIVLDDANKKYAIETFSYLKGQGRYQKLITCKLNIYESFKSLPIQGEGKKINFLGIYHKGEADESAQNDSSCDYYEFKGKTISLEINQELLINHRNLTETFYLGQQVDPKYAEIKFLRDFIDVQKEGDWKIKAEERLAALGYKYENGFVIEVEAKKK
jgi:hypothetical protein